MNNSKKIAQSLGNKIAYLNRAVFDNYMVPVYIIPAHNKEWEEETGITGYNSIDDFYVVLVKNINKLTIRTEAGLFGCAAHEVRHRFQKEFPNSILSKEFLIKLKLLNKHSLFEIHDLKELDAIVIEEIIRKICGNLNLQQIIKKKTAEIISFLACDENNFLNLMTNINRND